MDAYTEEIVSHILFFLGVIGSLGIILCYRRTVRILISTTLFFISFACTAPTIYISFIPLDIIFKDKEYIPDGFLLLFVYIYGLPLLFLTLLLVIKFFKIRMHSLSLLWLVNSAMYSFTYLLLWFIYLGESS